MVVIGYGGAQVQKEINGFRVHWVHQKRQLGTADAVRTALKKMHLKKGPLLILSGDVPLIRPNQLIQLKDKFEETGSALTMMTTDLKDPTGYGRVVRSRSGELARIVEQREATEADQAIQEINAGIYLMQIEEVLGAIQEIQKSPVKKEYYLTDLVEILIKKGKRVTSTWVAESEACLGINNKEQLVAAEELLRKNINQGWMQKGVLLKNPDTISIGPDVKIEPEVVIHQGVVLDGKTHIGRGAVILPYTVIEDSKVARFASVGPFSHLRPGSDVGPEARVGNFVELKKTVLKKGAKANHLTYLGDAVVGENTNIGCGTITCNYDGFKKHKTILGNNVFVGSDVQFVAPVKVESGAWIAAGTTVTQNVPAKSLAISRVEQKNIKGWARRRGKR